MDDAGKWVVKVAPRMAGIDAGAWDRLANPDPAQHNPFVAHAFLEALETSGSVGGRSGWQPQHLTIEVPEGRLLGAMPLYRKTHSQGEYVFDHGWAEAYARAGGRYYPKLQCAVPFTPVTGPRLLTGEAVDGEVSRLLGAAAIALAERLDASSVHVTFPRAAEWETLALEGYLKRTGQQFQWSNAGYDTFDDFLASLSSRKRKMIRKERIEALSGGVEIVRLCGTGIREAHWDDLFRFYMDTGSRKWGRPYLNRDFFSHLGAAMAERCLLILAQRAGRAVAGAFHLIGGDCLYGRYWGAAEHHPCLHFELCYYQAIEHAITHRLARVEAGAQGEHKLARGYLPVTTYSAHFLRDPRLARAVGRFLDEEREDVDAANRLLAAAGPYRRTGDEGSF